MPLSPDHGLFLPALEAVMALGHPQVQCCLPRLWSALQLSTKDMVGVLQRRSHVWNDEGISSLMVFFCFFCPCVQFANNASSSCAADILVGCYGSGGDPVTPAAAADWQVCVTCVPTFEHSWWPIWNFILLHACMFWVSLASSLAKVLNNLLQHEAPWSV